MAEIIRFGRQTFSASRYRDYQVSPSRERMVVHFFDPEESVRIEGGENVQLALQEIEAALTPQEDPRIWHDVD